LPGDVVRAIGACYSYISEERPVPVSLHDRILQATLGTTEARQVRAPFPARVADWMRGWLDTFVSPQLATVATMVLLAIFVGTSTISPDGSISGLYNATLRLAAQTYVHGANTARNAAQSGELKRVAETIVGEEAEGNPSESNKQPASGPGAPAAGDAPSGQQPDQTQDKH
jgi:hypothetical protein